MLKKCFTFRSRLFLFAIHLTIAFTQNTNKNFSILPIEIEGQETAGVKSIAQDQQGFIWLITSEGLIKDFHT